MPKKLGLALGSGAARGVAHVGFLQAIDEAGIKADFVTGCSMGAIIGACYCAGVPVTQIRDRVLSLKFRQFASLAANPYRAQGLFRLNKARKMMRELIGEKNFSELEIPFQCVATDLYSGKIVVLSEGDVALAALASGSVPGIFAPVKIGDYCLVDGAVLERVPTKELKKMGAEVVVAVDVLGDLTKKKFSDNIVNALLRCVDIIDTRVTERKKNSRKRNVNLWLEPDLSEASQYKMDAKSLKLAYEKGYELGKENVNAILSLIED